MSQRWGGGAGRGRGTLTAASLICLACAAVILPAEVPAALAAWRTETLTPVGVLAPLALSFDTAGDGLLLWNGNPNAVQPPRAFVGAELRLPSGSWGPAPEPPFTAIEQLQLYGHGWALLVGSETLTVQSSTPPSGSLPCCGSEPGTVERVRVLYADGSASGAFGPAQVLDEDGSVPVSAADEQGDAIVAWVHGKHYRVAERSGGRPFSAPLTLPGRALAGAPVTAALNAHGERVLAWVQDGEVFARVRQPRRAWGPAELVRRLSAPARPVPRIVLHAAITPSGTAVLAWESASGCEGCATVLRAGVAAGTPSGRWRTFPVESSSILITAPGGSVGDELADIEPLIDSFGRVYVVWTGGLEGAPIVKLAQLGAAGIGLWTPLSDSLLGGVLDNATAGPNGALLVSWSDLSQSSSGVGPVAVSLRPDSEKFALYQELTGENVTSGSGIVAFQPLSGEALAVSGVIVAGQTQLQVSSLR